MKRSFVCTLVTAFLLVLFASGCVHRTHSAHFNPAPRGKSVALAITIAGGSEPTPAQWAAILQVVEPQLVAQGWVLVTDFAAAENILRIDFSPNPNDPDHSGHASILSFRANPLRALAVLSPRRYPGSSGTFSYANYPGGYHNFLGYDRYDRFYDDYYTYYPPTRTVTPPNTRTTRPGHRGDDHCPPWVAQLDAARRAAPPADFGRSRSEGGYRGDSYSHSSSSSRGSDGSSSYSNSAPAARADSTYSRSEPSYTSYSSSSSSSSSSYSPPSSSYSAPSSSSDSGSSSSGSSGTHQSTQAHQN